MLTRPRRGSPGAHPRRTAYHAGLGRAAVIVRYWLTGCLCRSNRVAPWSTTAVRSQGKLFVVWPQAVEDCLMLLHLRDARTLILSLSISGMLCPYRVFWN